MEKTTKTSPAPVGPSKRGTGACPDPTGRETAGQTGINGDQGVAGGSNTMASCTLSRVFR